jgi:solute carrier family 35 protein F5
MYDFGIRRGNNDSSFQHASPHLDADDTLSPLDARETAKLASIFCLFWFLANWTVNASLGFTSVASTTILTSMSGELCLTKKTRGKTK